MRRIISGLLGVVIVLTAACSRGNEVAKRDIDFLYETIEHVWQVTIDYTRKGQAERGLDLCHQYVKERQGEIEAAGKRMSEYMFQDEVRQYYADRTQKNREATDKYEDYLTKNLNSAQMKRFNDILAEMVAEKYMMNIEWTTDPYEFHKKALKAKLGL